jgi:hypothetical protein
MLFINIGNIISKGKGIIKANNLKRGSSMNIFIKSSLMSSCVSSVFVANTLGGCPSEFCQTVRKADNVVVVEIHLPLVASIIS